MSELNRKFGSFLKVKVLKQSFMVTFLFFFFRSGFVSRLLPTCSKSE